MKKEYRRLSKNSLLIVYRNVEKWYDRGVKNKFTKMEGYYEY
jgi:hypothetical protein